MGERLAPAAVVVLSLLGAAVAVYLTSVHYASVPLACSSSGVINCEQVLTSKYSEVLGVPWSVGGIAWFGVGGFLAGLSLRRPPEAEWLQPAQVGWGLLGTAVVLYLVGVEIAGVKHVCIWCTSMHALIVLILLLFLFRRPVMEEEPEAVVRRPASRP